ncbi:MAG: hypothetical protein CVT74_15940 [Alphaproteobacteria bacterium HGW-Alphaproteobacteria-13]|nr:MAG: hypothetical protein CVT74_15940 [Alphaproteobacteria bacterium HGW-Alphaproteobacteria-13]
MKIGECKQGWHGFAIRAIALLAIPLLLIVMGRLAFEYLPRLGLPSCEEPDGLTLAAHGLEAALILVAIWLQMRMSQRPSYAVLIAVFLVPSTVWLIQGVANDREALRQQQCAARSLDEAMMVCGADPAHYRRETYRPGFEILTVIDPRAFDRRAWSCLGRWALHSRKASVDKVDESVYREYNKAHSKGE